MPSLTVRSIAEMLQLPAHAQARILREQKYPKQAPQVFRTPYYQPALTGIRRYFRAGNDKAELAVAKTNITLLSRESKREQNSRVLDGFAKSALSKRKLLLQTNPGVRAQMGAVELRLGPDLRVLENGLEEFIFLNCRAQALDSDVAIRTAEIAHWVLEQSGVKIPIGRIEYVDLFTGKSHATTKRRAATTKALIQNFKIIEALWPTL